MANEPLVSVTRVIQIVGSKAWVEKTLAEAFFPQANMQWECVHGTIKCKSLERIEGGPDGK